MVKLAKNQESQLMNRLFILVDTSIISIFDTIVIIMGILLALTDKGFFSRVIAISEIGDFSSKTHISIGPVP